MSPPESAPRTPTPGSLLDPERAGIQARTPDSVKYSPTQRPYTASPDQHGAPHTETDRTTASVTATPVLDDYDVQDFSDSHQVESVPLRGDTLFPMQLPPLPTTRSQPAHLDISHGGEEGGQEGSGRSDSSGSGEGGSSDDSSSGAEAGAVNPTQVWTETASRPSWFVEKTTGSEQGAKTTARPSGLQEETPEPGDPAKTEEVGQQPAVVFKEDVTAGTTLTFHLEQSPAIPVDGESSAKPPFHLIIVNVHDQNQSGELGWGYT